MARTESTDMPLGSRAPDFALPDTLSGTTVSRSDYAGKPLLLVFMCNHCPYVVHILDELVSLAHDADARGVATVTISANDAVAYPRDAPDRMAELAADRQFGFPYCYDEDQTVARAYDAVCTPDIFLFDADHRLYYHGQFDATRPGGDEKPTGTDLRMAIDGLLSGEAPPQDARPSVGCNIKWKS